MADQNGAGASEAPLCGGENVFVIGGGNSAGQAVMHLAAHAAEWIPTTRLFVAIGGVPNTDWAADTAIVREPGGYLVTGLDVLTDGRSERCAPMGAGT